MHQRESVTHPCTHFLQRDRPNISGSLRFSPLLFPPLLSVPASFVLFLFFSLPHINFHMHMHIQTRQTHRTHRLILISLSIFILLFFFAETRNFTCLPFLPLPSPTSKTRFLFSKGRTGCPVPPHLNLAWSGVLDPPPHNPTKP